MLMVLGERIKKIRTFRGLTQRESGLKLGYAERTLMFVSHRMRLSIMLPQNNTLNGNGKDTGGQLYPFYGCYPRFYRDIMLTFLWLDEDDRIKMILQVAVLLQRINKEDQFLLSSLHINVKLNFRSQ